MKNIMSAFLLFASLGASAQQDDPADQEHGAHDRYDTPGIILIEEAIETDSLRLSLNNNLTGFVEGKVCDECETIKVTITPRTKAYENNVEVPLKTVTSRLGRPATVYYLIATKEVSRIRW